MPFPVNIHLGNATIPSHQILEILAYMLGFRYYLYLRKKLKDTISDENRLWIFIAAAGGAFIFSHVIGVLERPDQLYRMSFIYFMTYPLILGMCIGRLGCFLAGLEDGTYGIVSDVPWAIDFGDGTPRHPAQLYEILFLIILWLGLRLFEQKRILKDGAKFKIYLATYCVFRFFVEFIKPAYFFNFGLSVLQITALSGIIYYWKIFIFPHKILFEQPSQHFHQVN